ncbi:NAD(P)-dependent malic enzyme [Ructibacterium gallinarum]|uniref:NAD-dependent malic enzyme n=1 Tax=Ructibacterium gallinarum TaxID=2779355 RepID=A0A9D5RBF5_9FIRM|nr:malic enzyme-like NAD(P)-binding protein [Ructibacterium gallinarum]MBE5039973.1 NAD-dependent malic enzyme [Ructibacterium gallinarum]
MNYNEQALKLHKELRGKIEVSARAQTQTTDQLSVAYTPGVAEPCREIAKDKGKVYDYTRKGNLVAVVTDGSAVLGLGNIGPEAAMPVMEGKCVLFKNFADVDAFPICLATQDVDEIVNTVKNIAPGFGGINLEDISAPRCFEVERRLQEALDIPVFHDDQHGTAIVVCAGILNALRVVNKQIENVKIIVNGAGSAGIAIAKMLLAIGAKNLTLVDKAGAIFRGMDGVNPEQAKMAEITNPELQKGNLSDVLKGADVLIGVSAPNIVSEEMVRSMAKDPVVFAMANPIPEIMPEKALAAGAAVVGSGRSDYPNQINNVLVFPGLFRGALDAGAKRITEEMKAAAVYALAALIPPEELSPQNIIPKAFDPRVSQAVAKAAADAWKAQN